MFMGLLVIIERLLCFFIGHKPRGPENTDNDLSIYRCDRCTRLIYFSKKKGWQVKKEWVGYW